MKSYYQAIQTASELGNMPDALSSPAKFIIWAEDICELIADIYSRSYDEVTQDLSERLGLLNEDDED